MWPSWIRPWAWVEARPISRPTGLPMARMTHRQVVHTLPRRVRLPMLPVTTARRTDTWLRQVAWPQARSVPVHRRSAMVLSRWEHTQSCRRPDPLLLDSTRARQVFIQPPSGSRATPLHRKQQHSVRELLRTTSARLRSVLVPTQPGTCPRHWVRLLGRKAHTRRPKVSTPIPLRMRPTARRWVTSPGPKGTQVRHSEAMPRRREIRRLPWATRVGRVANTERPWA